MVRIFQCKYPNFLKIFNIFSILKIFNIEFFESIEIGKTIGKYILIIQIAMMFHWNFFTFFSNA